MRLDLIHNGIVHRYDDGRVVIYRPRPNGGTGIEIEAPGRLADAFRLATGDVVVGSTRPVEWEESNTQLSDECLEDEVAAEEQRDEPAAIRGESPPNWIVNRLGPTELLSSVESVNGLSGAAAMDRAPARRRFPSERVAPDRWVSLATSPNDVTGRILDFSAPLGRGDVGMVHGPHGAGLTSAMRSVVAGAAASNAFDHVLLLLLRARSEEITDWRRRFPNVEIVVCSSIHDLQTAEQCLRVADLCLACAQRQTELGRHVLLAVDSLTGLWGSMLEAEQADEQSRADTSRARQRVRAFVQGAGNFAGQPPLGGGVGGSLTIVGSAWRQDLDYEAEEEGETHPHLRLIEHIIGDCSWQVPLQSTLAKARAFPAIDPCECISRFEDRLLPSSTLDRVLNARRALSAPPKLERHNVLMDALDRSTDLNGLLNHLPSESGAPKRSSARDLFAMMIPDSDEE